MNKKLMIGIVALLMAVGLAACGGNEETAPDSNTDTENDSSENTEMNEESNSEEENDSMKKTDHSGMDHSSSGEVPEDLANAEDPTYPVGSEAVISADHMKGMDGAVATIEGAYDTTVYAVTYTPTTGGEEVENHKWVIHEEIENPEEQPYEHRDEVVLNADHMEGMKGASAIIDSAEDNNVYMVSYTDSETGEKVENHKWVTENELSPVE
ncbi:cytoskeletal protein RodZ [Oceanobacillus polygoni]|uniref:Cytoskeletal protein RodZ n=2 Tax=Oceanobacillus polygoni TaxID=1235259 RepID=A0A9X0YNA4_9BACI|nr:cytoskeletal protein RodZ [Oceanobacillus polygoni]